MSLRLQDALEEGERLLWERRPAGGELRRAVRAVQVAGHLLLTGVSVLLALSVPVGLGLRAALAAILCLATNAPLMAWAVYRWPKMRGSGDATFFVTDRRVGSLRASGEFRQLPVCRALTLTALPGTVQFRLGEGATVSFGGLSQDETRLVSILVRDLVKKAPH